MSDTSRQNFTEDVPESGTESTESDPVREVADETSAPDQPKNQKSEVQVLDHSSDKPFELPADWDDRTTAQKIKYALFPTASSNSSSEQPSVTDTASETLQNAVNGAKDSAKGAKDLSKDATNAVGESAENTAESARDTTECAAKEVKDRAGEIMQQAGEKVGNNDQSSRKTEEGED